MKAIYENTILGRIYGPRGRAREEDEEEKETLHNEVHDMYISYNSVSDYIKVIFNKIFSGRQPCQGVKSLQCLRAVHP